jgi:hypothetical protein
VKAVYFNHFLTFLLFVLLCQVSFHLLALPELSSVHFLQHTVLLRRVSHVRMAVSFAIQTSALSPHSTTSIL